MQILHIHLTRRMSAKNWIKQTVREQNTIQNKGHSMEMIKRFVFPLFLFFLIIIMCFKWMKLLLLDNLLFWVTLKQMESRNKWPGSEVFSPLLSRCSPCQRRWAAAPPPATHLAQWCRCASPALRPRCWTAWTDSGRKADSVTCPSTCRVMCSRLTAASWLLPHLTSTTRCVTGTFICTVHLNQVQKVTGSIFDSMTCNRPHFKFDLFCFYSKVSLVHGQIFLTLFV